MVALLNFVTGIVCLAVAFYIGVEAQEPPLTTVVSIALAVIGGSNLAWGLRLAHKAKQKAEGIR